MNTTYLFVAIAALFFAAACTPKLDTDQKRVTYVIGQQISKNMAHQNIELDPKVLAMSVKDGQKGESKMTPEEMQATLNKLAEESQKKQAVIAEENKKKAVEFLEKNKSSDGVKVTNSGVQYIIEKEGTGKNPTKADRIKAVYKASTVDGNIFEKADQPVEFPLQGLVPGWAEAFQMLKPGGKGKFFIPPELAYGPSARNNLPSNSVVVMDIELHEIVKPAAAAATKKKE